MFSELFGAVAKAAVRKVVNMVVDNVSDSDGNQYPDEIVRKFQKFLRGVIYVQLVHEIEHDYLGAEGLSMTPEQRWNRSQQILRERHHDILRKHRELKQKLIVMAQEEKEAQMGNDHPNYERYEQLESSSHFEAFIVVVIGEWEKRSDIYLGADDDTDTESFSIWHNSIDEAIQHKIVTMDEIQSQEL